MISRDKYIVKRDTQCWEWKGARTKAGYGRTKYKGEAWMAHRLMYTLTNGSIPDGMVVMHQCDNPCCVNPEHLSVGTQKDNMADCKSKGRLGPRGRGNNIRPKETPTERRVRMVLAAHRRGDKPITIAKKLKLSLLWVRRVIEVETLTDQ